MDERTARGIVENLMEQHGLMKLGWTFEFDNAKKRLGLCRFNCRVISLSRYMVSAADRDKVEQVALHEVAHALLRPGAYHGIEWKRKAREIGYRGARTTENPYQSGPKVRRTMVQTLRFSVGDVIVSGNLSGVIDSVGSTRYKVSTTNGSQYYVPFEHCALPSAAEVDRIRESVKANCPAPLSRNQLVPAGKQVTITAGKYAGRVGTVLGVGRSRYKVDIDGIGVLNAPFSMAS